MCAASAAHLDLQVWLHILRSDSQQNPKLPMKTGLALALTLFFAIVRPATILADPRHSGIQGQAVVSPNVTLSGAIWGGQPIQTEVSVWTGKGKFVTSFTTAADGTFEVELHPGDYVLIPEAPPNVYLSPVQTPVSVEKNEFTPITVGYYGPPL